MERKRIPINEAFFGRQPGATNYSFEILFFSMVLNCTWSISICNTVLKSIDASIIEARVTVHSYFCSLPSFFTQWSSHNSPDSHTVNSYMVVLCEETIQCFFAILQGKKDSERGAAVSFSSHHTCFLRIQYIQQHSLLASPVLSVLMHETTPGRERSFTDHPLAITWWLEESHNPSVPSQTKTLALEPHLF